MNLYTVIIDFEDRTRAVEQVEYMSEVEALHKTLREAEALECYDKSAIEETIDSYLQITHLAMGYKGTWLWHHFNFDNEEMDPIYGRAIVQIDQNGAVRESSS